MQHDCGGRESHSGTTSRALTGGAGTVLGLVAKDEKRVQKHQQQGQHGRLALSTRNLAGALAADCHASKELSSVPAPQGTRLAAAVEGNELPRLAEELPQQKKPKPSSRKSKPSPGGLLASSSSPSPWHKQPLWCG